MNLQDTNVYFRFSRHQWDLLLHSSALIIHPVKAVFQHGTGKEKGEETRRTKGGGECWGDRGRQESRKDCLLFQRPFLVCYNMQTKMVLGSGHFFLLIYNVTRICVANGHPTK